MPFQLFARALYDYTAQSEDELTVTEDALLYIIDKEDGEWWKAKLKVEGDKDGPIGLIPSNYVEASEPVSIVKALFDYTATTEEELTVKEDDTLLIFETDGEWFLAQRSTDKDGGLGYVPENYTGPVEEEQEAEAAAQPNAVFAAIPAAQPEYVSPDEMAAGAKDRAKADDIKTWTVSEVDAKKKKKKGTLGVGNGAIFFASEADKAPVRQWPITDVSEVSTERGKHLHLILSGANAATLHFHTGNSSTLDEIVTKIDSSRSIADEAAAPSSAASSPSSGLPSSMKDLSIEPPPVRTQKGVHFAPSPTSPTTADESEEEEEEEATKLAEGEPAVALYDFEAEADDELSVAEGDALLVLDRVASEEWWKCHSPRTGKTGVVPGSYVELNSATVADADTAHEDAAAAAAAEEAARQKEQGRIAAAEAERREREERERQEKMQAEQAKRRAEEAAKRRAAEEARKAQPAPTPPIQRKPSDNNMDKARKLQPKDRSLPDRPSPSGGSRARPNPEKTRIWHDKTGQFKVEAEFLGVTNGKIRLHKLNGVTIEVPKEKMSTVDLAYIDKVSASSASAGHDEDDVPLGRLQEKRRSMRQLQTQLPLTETRVRTASAPRNRFDWFEFFLNAGCDVDDCTRYASAFERDKMDESILADIEPATMRTLGLREGDIIRVKKAIAARTGSGSGSAGAGTPTPDAAEAARQEQIRKDEEFARKLQAGGADERVTSPAPNLFVAGPGGALKASRRGRPQTKTTAPSAIDAASISTASEQLTRTATPPVVTSPPPAPTSPPPPAAAPAPPAVSPAPAAPIVQLPSKRSSSTIPLASGFDDDAWTVKDNKPTSPAAPQPRAPQSTGSFDLTQQRPATGSPALSNPTGGSYDAILAKINQHRPPSAPVQTSVSTGAMSTGTTPIASPMASPPPQSYHAGLGMGSSPMSLSALQAQPTGAPAMHNPNAPRGPLAPVPANQALLQPLVPTNTGIHPFMPTRTGGSGFGAGGAGLQPQATGWQPHQQQQGLQPQATGWQPQQGMQPQATGWQPQQQQQQQQQQQPALQPQVTGWQQSPQIQPQPGQQASFGSGFQSNPSGLFAQQPSPAPQPPAQSSAPNFQPSNIFAQMRSGQFAGGSGSGQNGVPQSADKYDALRPQPTGMPMGMNFGQGLQPQPTGFFQQMQPQPTGFQPQFGYQQR